MRKVIAMQPILYDSRMYKAGDSIPCTDTGLIELWVKNRAARVYGDAPPPIEPTKQEPGGSADAPTTKQPGQSGGEGDTPVTDQPDETGDKDKPDTEPAASSEETQEPAAPPAPQMGRSRSRAANTPEATPT